MLQELRRYLSLYYQRLYNYILSAQPGSLPLTGILGLAALLIAYYQLKRNDAPSDSRQRGQTQTQHAATDSSAAAANAGRLAAGSSSKSTANKQLELSGAPAVRRKLSGIRKITISSLGPLTEEWTSTELQEGATLRSDAVDILKEVCACADTYIITQVQDDIGQAVLTGSLEAAGLVGDQAGQLKPHRVLFCSTLDGKVSMVRQLEPDLHIDGSAKTIDDLKRFMPQLLHIPQPGTPVAGQGSSNVISSSSLKAFFHS